MDGKTHMIRLVKVNKVTDQPSVPDGFIPINTLSWFHNNVYKDIPCYQVTPYYLKDEHEQIFENIWQFSKCYRHVYAQKQIYGHKVIWEHPAEVHVSTDDTILPAYWEWRQKGYRNPYPVRYPNGFHGRHECVCALFEVQGEWKILNYLDSRKKIYCQLYAELVQRTEAFKQLQQLHQQGINLQFIDIDVPSEPIMVSSVTYQQYLNDPSLAFGHTWTLACCLMGQQWWIDSRN